MSTPHTAPPTPRGPSDDAIRSRIALGALTAGGAGAFTYALLRVWVYLRGGGGGMALLLRQQTIGYFQALAVSAFVGLSLGIGVVALTTDPSELTQLERVLRLGIVPVMGASALLYYFLP